LAVQGVVQGVGFRPFVHNLAHRLGLGGWVRNTATGVEIELEGAAERLERFASELRREPPPLARILDFQVSTVPTRGEGALGLRIIPSRDADGRTLVSPDVATCRACVAEIQSPEDRRAGYAFTNCTHCGPRFSIISGLPYDRPRTTMAAFEMCPACRAEYTDPDDRRFHAQPVACASCGPVVWLTGGDDVAAPSAESPTADGAIAAAVECLTGGGVLALKGLGGFHLACRAGDSDAVRRLRRVKQRPCKPLAVMVGGVGHAREFAVVSDAEERLLEAPEAPIALLRKRPGEGAGLAPEIAPANGYVGVMLPYTPLHHLLMARAGSPLVMTSGNPVGEPLCVGNPEAVTRLGSFTDAYLIHDRAIQRRCDDSVMMVADLPGGPVTQPARRSRGLAPLPVLLPNGCELTRELVAAGADLKNVSAVATGRQAFLTQHIGDLAHPAAREEQAHAVADLERLFRIRPRVVACDAHPAYASSRWARDRAREEGLDLVEVQHHHAHIAGCLAENGYTGRAIGLSFDGTGYGTDGHIWGGEVLWAGLGGFERCAHLEYLPLPGGDAAIRHPERIALAYLMHLLPNVDPARLLPRMPEAERRLVSAMVDTSLNTAFTSSMGRLFDAASALLGLCSEATHEAQAAIALEAAALRGRADGAAYDLECGSPEIRVGPLLQGVLADLEAEVPVPDIARRFHQSVARLCVSAARWVRAGRGEGAEHVALSGGVWQNRLLLETAAQELAQAGFEVLVHQAVPANDGGLAFGQVAVAAARAADAAR